MSIILLVDDEVLTRNGIRDNIAWDEIGIDTVLTARNGIEALEVLSDRRPDILITDIRMPRMNGIDLANHIRGAFPDCVILFLSGYSDEEYLRSAIKVKAEQYVNKPVNLEMLSETLGEIMEELRERQRRGRQAELSSRVALGLMMSRPLADKAELYEALGSIKLRGSIGPGPGYPLSCLIFQAAISDDSPGEDLDIRQLQEDVNGLFAGHGFIPIIYADAENTVVCFLFSAAHGKNLHNNGEHIRQILRNHRNLFPLEYAIALGETVPSVERSSHAFATAKARLKTSFYLGTSELLSEKDISFSMDISLCNAVNNIKTDISRGRYDGIKRDIQKLKENFTETLPPVEHTKALLHDLLLAIEWKVGGNEPLPIGVFENISTLDGCMGIIMDRVAFLEHGHEGGGRLADRARDIIDNKFGDLNLSITMLCDELALTAPYLCYLFKQRHGMTINHYINKIRIETAKNLLTFSQLKIHDIAHRCGFNNTNYFTRSFKKNTGQLPTQYRLKDRV
ncbi:MAG: response regulator [Treponema sp.]|jgi:two-component system response regulator YesN|nr:response regulator [Treponema sp.]